MFTRRYRQTDQKRQDRRWGATVVEMGVVLPVFGVFLAGLMEFGHAYMVVTTIKGATKQAARFGIANEITADEVEVKCKEVLGAGFDPSFVTIYVKDASIFDEGGDVEDINYSGLPDIVLEEAEPRQLFVVRAEVNYDNLALLPPFWIRDTVLSGQSVMRHE